ILSILASLFSTYERVQFRFFFFFQAEDGIRVFHVTGVQTCALPISPRAAARAVDGVDDRRRRRRGAAGPRRRYRGGSRGGARGEIGRASCRERGESSAACVAQRIHEL